MIRTMDIKTVFSYTILHVGVLANLKEKQLYYPL